MACARDRAIFAAGVKPAWRLFAFCANAAGILNLSSGQGQIMRVLGIDPGLRNMGWGLIDVAGSRLTHVANGICHSTGDDLALRLLSLHTQLSDVIARYAPTAAAVEQTFVNKDGAGTLKLGQARGIALLVTAQAGLRIGEYAPNAIKKAVVGVGHADKVQVAHMVKLQLPAVQLAGPDAADALAIAICHAHHLQSANRMVDAVARALA
jgi:crossover junction endodeoxyribonuclease RuvC